MRVNDGVNATVVSALRQAAARTGTDFGFLMAQARAESGLRADAKASTSSASGLFQFTRLSWLDMIQRHGRNHPALNWAADALKSGAAQAGTAVREAVLALRNDPEAASLMAGEMARDNMGKLQVLLGRNVGAGEVHLAHFLGLGGATRFLQALAVAPSGAAADIVPQAAAANRSLFFSKDGKPFSLDRVMQLVAGKVSQSGAESFAPASSSTTSAVSFAGADRSEQARAAYLLLAELGG